jgi:hypothetical protein
MIETVFACLQTPSVAAHQAETIRDLVADDAFTISASPIDLVLARPECQ